MTHPVWASDRTRRFSRSGQAVRPRSSRIRYTRDAAHQGDVNLRGIDPPALRAVADERLQAGINRELAQNRRRLCAGVPSRRQMPGGAPLPHWPTGAPQRSKTALNQNGLTASPANVRKATAPPVGLPERPSTTLLLVFCGNGGSRLFLVGLVLQAAHRARQRDAALRGAGRRNRVIPCGRVSRHVVLCSRGESPWFKPSNEQRRGLRSVDVEPVPAVERHLRKGANGFSTRSSLLPAPLIGRHPHSGFGAALGHPLRAFR